jgi:hypothetical protein
MNPKMKRSAHLKRPLVGLIAAPKAIALSLMYFAQSASPSQFAEGGPTDFNALREATEKALAKIGDQVKEAGEKALAEAKKSGDMYAADKPKVDEMLVKQGELQAQLADVQQKLARRGEEEKKAELTAGAHLTASPEFKAWIDGGGMKSTQSGYVHPLPRASLTSIATTNTTTVGVQSGHAARRDSRHRTQRLTIRDLITPGRRRRT